MENKEVKIPEDVNKRTIKIGAGYDAFIYKMYIEDRLPSQLDLYTAGYFLAQQELQALKQRNKDLEDGLREIEHEGYDAYSNDHHLVVQRWLEKITKLLNPNV